jgi:eukaryotic-like serine/threonine-protein kinase
MIQRCPQCGAVLPSGMLAGHCPNCLVQTALDSDRATAAAEQPVSFPRAFGDYELLEEVARGGMGIVYRARQRSLNRMVAIKMILAGEFASPEFVRRFRHEAAAAASLQHAHIVAIHEVGEASGQHYFSMDLVEGRNLAELVRDQALPARRAATYVKTIAEAVHFAHAKGILHRDLKPSNILIDAFDQPRITDFGLAKEFRSGAELTQSGQALGSPAYMPPEQAAGKHALASPASDLYSLGAILYHLLTGRPPFQGETLHQVLLQVQGTEPIAPRRLNPGVPEDLQTICLKCLEKDPTRRYPTARDFADELGRFLRDEPIAARPIGAVDKIWRWCRRRPAVASLSASVLLLLFVVAFGSSFAVWQVDRARQAEHAANRDLRQTVNLLELERAEDFFDAHDAAFGVAHLSAMLRRDPSNTLAANRLVSALAQRGWAVPSEVPLRHAGRVTTASFSRDGRRVLSASWDRTAAVWDVVNGRQLFALRHEDMILSARYSVDGHRIITASADGTAQIADAATGTVQSWLRHSNKVQWAEFSRDGALAVTACADNVARIWDANTGELKRELSGHTGSLVIARFSPDAKFVATATGLGGLRLWSVESEKMVFKLVGDHDFAAIETLAFSQDGRHLISGGDDHTARLWNIATGEPVGAPLAHRSVVWHAEFSPDGKLLLTTCEDGAARLWDVQTMQLVGEPLRHQSGVTFGQFSPDGQSVVTASSDNTARVWDVRTQTPLCQPLRHIERVIQAGFSADGLRLVTASYDGVAQVWELRPHLEPSVQIQYDHNVAPIVLSSDGAAILTAGRNNTLRLWDVRTGQPLSEPMLQESWVASGDVAPDGHRVAVAFTDHTVRVLDFGEGKTTDGTAAIPRIASGPMRHGNRVHTVRFSPDGSRIVTASADGTAHAWDATNGQSVAGPLVHGGAVVMAQFSRDGRMIVTASEDYTARVWDAQTGKPLTEPLAHIDHVKSAEFSPDGTRVLTASSDNSACLWDARTGRKLITLQHARIVEQAVFSPDGRRIATACLDRTAQIWDAHTGQALTPALRHDVPVARVRFSSDARRVFTTSWTSPARLWDSETGRPVTEWLTTKEPWGATFDPGSGRVIMGATNGIARVWNMPEVPVPVPEWFVDLAEALAGIRLAERGAMELAPRQKLKDLVTQIASNASTNEYERLARWFGLPSAR